MDAAAEQISSVLRGELPSDLHDRADAIASRIVELLRGHEPGGRWPGAGHLDTVAELFAGRAFQASNALISFGAGAHTGNITIGPIAGGNITTFNITIGRQTTLNTRTGTVTADDNALHLPLTVYLRAANPAAPSAAALARSLRLRGVRVVSGADDRALASIAACVLLSGAPARGQGEAFRRDVARVRAESARRALPVLVARDGDAPQPRPPSAPLRAWESCTLDGSPYQVDHAARLVLDALLAVYPDYLSRHGELDLGFFTAPFSNPSALIPALSIDWRELYTPPPGDTAPARYPSPDEWRALLHPALVDLRSFLGGANLRCLNLLAFARLSASAALGYTFRSVAGLQFRLLQNGEWWATAQHDERLASLDVVPIPTDADRPDLSLELNITLPRGALSKDVGDYLQAGGPRVGRRLALERPPTLARHLDEQTAQAVASQVRTTLQENKHPSGVRHLFMAAPFGLALMIGWHLNALTPVQCYEMPQGGWFISLPA